MPNKNESFTFIRELPRDQSLLVNDLINNLTAYLTDIKSNNLSVMKQLSTDITTHLKSLVDTNTDLKDVLVSVSRLKAKSINDVIKTINRDKKNKIEQILSNSLYTFLLNKYKSYEDIFGYLNTLSLFRYPISANNIASVELNQSALESHIDYAVDVYSTLNNLASKAEVTLEDIVDAYLEVMSEIDKKKYLNDKSIITAITLKLKESLNSINATNSFSRGILPLLKDNINSLVDNFIENKLPLNELTRVSLTPIFNSCDDIIRTWLIGQIQQFKSPAVKDSYHFFEQLPDVKIDIYKVILEGCPRIRKKIRYKIFLAYKNSSHIKPIGIRQLTEHTEYKKGDSIYVSGLGISSRDMAIVDYNGELIHGRTPAEHHQDIMAWYDPNNEKECRAWIEQYNNVAVIVALQKDINTVKQDCLKDNFKKVVYYDDDAAPDGSPVNKVVLAKRLMRRCH